MILTVFLIGIGLSMDAFSVSISNGLCLKKVKFKNSFEIAFLFGFFQFLMPVIGFHFGNIFSSIIEPVSAYFGFVLLSFIGVKMIIEAVDSIKHNKKEKCKIMNFKLLVIQAVATSIDALAVGISFVGNLSISIWLASALIGITTFILCFPAVYIGKKVGSIFKERAEIFGGLILIGIGIKILLQYLL